MQWNEQYLNVKWMHMFLSIHCLDFVGITTEHALSIVSSQVVSAPHKCVDLSFTPTSTVGALVFV